MDWLEGFPEDRIHRNLSVEELTKESEPQIYGAIPMSYVRMKERIVSHPIPALLSPALCPLRTQFLDELALRISFAV